MHKRKLLSVAQGNHPLDPSDVKLLPAFAEVIDLLNLKMRKISKFRELYKKENAAKEIASLNKELTKKSFDGLGLNLCAAPNNRENEEAMSRRMLLSQLLSVFLQFHDITEEEFYHQPASTASTDIVIEGFGLMKRILSVCRFPNVRLSTIDGIIQLAVDATHRAHLSLTQDTETTSSPQSAQNYFTVSTTLLGYLLRNHGAALNTDWSMKIAHVLDCTKREQYFQVAEQFHNMMLENVDNELQGHLLYQHLGLKDYKSTSIEIVISRSPKYLHRAVYQIKSFVEIMVTLLAPRTAEDFCKRFRVRWFDCSYFTNKGSLTKQESNHR